MDTTPIIDVCDSCIEISTRPIRNTKEKPKLDVAIQCDDCGMWWELRYVKTIQYHLFEGKWRQLQWDWVARAYVPVTCQQRKCQEQARHRFSSGKRKWKCDYHAGVCIIA